MSYNLPVCVSACLSACLPACVFVCLSACLSACLRVCVSACLRVCLSACLPVCLSACLRVFLSACLPVCLSACLRVCRQRNCLLKEAEILHKARFNYIIQIFGICHEPEFFCIVTEYMCNGSLDRLLHEVLTFCHDCI